MLHFMSWITKKGSVKYIFQKVEPVKLGHFCSKQGLIPLFKYQYSYCLGFCVDQLNYEPSHSFSCQ